MIYESRWKGRSPRRLSPRQDSSGIPSSPPSEGQPSQTPTSDPSTSAPADPVQQSPTDSNPLPPSDTSPPPNTDPTSPPAGGGSSDTGSGSGGASQPNPTPTISNTGQSPTNGGQNPGQSPTNGGGSNGGQNSAPPPPAPTGAGSGPNNDAEGGLVTTNGQTLSIAGGVTVAVSQIVTEHNGHVTTITVPIATLTSTPTGLTTSQRDGIIAGSVVGGFVIGMVVIAFLFYRRRRRIRQQEKIESEVVARPRRLLHSDGPLDLTAGSTHHPYMTTAWTSQPQMAQYDTVDSRSPFTMGDPISSPRMSRARTSVSGSIFQEDVWPPPGEEYLGTLAGGSPSGAGLAPPSRTSLDTQGLSDSASPARPFAPPYDPSAPIQPPSPHPILTSFSPHGPRPSTPTSLVSSPISYSSGSRLIPSAAAAAKARESTSESTRARYNRSSWFGPTSGPHSAYSESEYGSGGGAAAAAGGGASSTLSQVDQAESSSAPPLIDLNTASSRAGTGSSGTTSDRGGFNEAINARLNPMGLGGGPSPGPTPLDNEIPPLYSMIRRDTDLSLEGGGTAPGRST